MSVRANRLNLPYLDRHLKLAKVDSMRQPGTSCDSVLVSNGGALQDRGPCQPTNLSAAKVQHTRPIGCEQVLFLSENRPRDVTFGSWIDLKAIHMPYFHFDLVIDEQFKDQGGMILEDTQVAFERAESLAGELSVVRPDLRSRGCAVRVTDYENRELYRTPIDSIPLWMKTRRPAAGSSLA